MKRWIAALLLEMVILTGCAQIILPFGVFEIGFTPAPMNTNVPDPTPTLEVLFPTALPPLQGRVNTTKLNIRSAPGVNNPDIGDLFIGEIVLIVGQNEASTWYQVENEDGVLLGWVDARYVELYRG